MGGLKDGTMMGSKGWKDNGLIRYGTTQEMDKDGVPALKKLLNEKPFY